MSNAQKIQRFLSKKSSPKTRKSGDTRSRKLYTQEVAKILKKRSEQQRKELLQPS